ncbi:MAG: tetratricopeptide repeat protein [Candidatus Cloacimonetes bacterium]|nr:tetratricopeptide repeat protein [Candidatus Cloacimonadota bacterium]
MKLSKNGKTAIGIYQDGMTIKVAQLTVVNGKISLTELSETTLSLPLYPLEVTPPDQGATSIDQEATEPIADLADFSEDFKIPDLAELEESEYEPAEEAEPVMTGKQEFQKLISHFPLDSCRLSMNALEENVSYTQFSETFTQSHSRSKIKKLIRDEILSKEEQKNKNYNFDFIRNGDNSLLAFVEKGRNDILQALQEINPLIYKKRFYFSYIEPIEVSLMNLVRNNYEFNEDDYVLLIYIGIDSKFGIIMKGNQYVKSFPLIVPESDLDRMRQVIYSKIILEQDTSNVNITRNVILAGEMSKDDDVQYFRNQINSGANITRISLDKLHIPSAKEAAFPPERIADYCIPISLAWKSLEGRNKNFYTCNLLPPKIIESQKPFKIEWHGFLVMAAIFYVAFSATFKNLDIKKDIIEISRENSQIEIELRRNRSIVVKLQQVKKEIDALQENLKKVDKLVGTKNQWYYILNVLSNAFKDNKISWITSFNTQDKNFKISGYTTRKRNVIPFSNLFPDGIIEKVIENTIQNIAIWQYDITYGYPDPIEVAKLKKESEPGIEFIKDTEQLSSPQVQIDSFKPAEKPKVNTATQLVKPVTSSARYNEIAQLYFSGNYQNAYNQFKEFLLEFPDSKYTNNASYLMGECLYQMKDVDQAILVFETVIKQGGLKTPDALMMLGNACSQKNNLDQAKIYWTRIVNEYPQNRLASIAEKKLAQLGPTKPIENSSINDTVENQSSELFDIQLYADGNYDNILNEQKKLNAAGYPTKIIPISTSSGVIYRLRVDGSFSRDKAFSLGKEISRALNSYYDFWITEAPVTNPSSQEDNAKIIDIQEEIRSEYASILEKYFSEDYQASYDGFYDFMKKYPDHDLASNAQYYMGEAQYQMDNLPEAITIFEIVLEKQDVKKPDALMMLGNAHAELGNNDQALYYWNELISVYPHHHLADIAQIKAIELKD